MKRKKQFIDGVWYLVDQPEMERPKYNDWGDLMEYYQQLANAKRYLIDGNADLLPEYPVEGKDYEFRNGVFNTKGEFLHWDNLPPKLDWEFYEVNPCVVPIELKPDRVREIFAEFADEIEHHEYGHGVMYSANQVEQMIANVKELLSESVARVITPGNKSKLSIKEIVEKTEEYINRPKHSKKNRDYTKFFTYPETAKFMVDLLDPKPNEIILEPSAGNGRLCKAVREKQPKCTIVAIEINPENETDLRLADADVVYIEDFLQFTHSKKSDRCIANPPFGNGVDLQAHFNHICKHVKEGGKIVMIVPADFTVPFGHNIHLLENWSKNSDGTTTEIKIIEFYNPARVITQPEKKKVKIEYCKGEAMGGNCCYPDKSCDKNCEVITQEKGEESQTICPSCGNELDNLEYGMQRCHECGSPNNEDDLKKWDEGVKKESQTQDELWLELASKIPPIGIEEGNKLMAELKQLFFITKTNQ